MRYALTRMLRFVLVFVVVTFVVMAITRLGSPDPLRDLAGGQVGEAQLQRAKDDFPYIEKCDGGIASVGCLGKQYAYWAKDMVTGNMGRSYLREQTTVEMLKQRGLTTFFLGFWAIFVGLVIAIPVGVYSAYRRDRLFDRSSSVASFALISMPPIVLGVLIQWYSKNSTWFPTRAKYFAPWDAPFDHLKNFLLPSIVLGLGLGAVWSRLLRADMSLTLQSDFINLARAKGVTPNRVLWVHALRSSILSLITSVALQLSGLVSGTVVVEQLFAMGGIGGRLVEAVQQNDILTIQAITAIVVAVVVVVNLFVDLLYAVIDPRIRQVRALG